MLRIITHPVVQSIRSRRIRVIVRRIPSLRNDSTAEFDMECAPVDGRSMRWYRAADAPDELAGLTDAQFATLAEQHTNFVYNEEITGGVGEQWSRKSGVMKFRD